MHTHTAVWVETQLSCLSLWCSGSNPGCGKGVNCSKIIRFHFLVSWVSGTGIG